MQAICWDNKNMPTQSDKFFVALLDETTPIHLVFGTFDFEFISKTDFKKVLSAVVS